MRVFFGLSLPPPVREALWESAVRLRAQGAGRLVRAESYHCTMVFMGEVEAAQGNKLRSILQSAASAMAPCILTLSGPGFFANRGEAVVWHGISGASPLETLCDVLRQGLRQASLPHDPKPFRPHITLARQVPVAGLNLEPLGARLVSWRADAVTLFESRREAGGMVYVPLAICGMGEGRRA